MSNGLNFTPEEEQEFKEMIAIRPKGFGERLSVFFDRIMNSIWTFLFLVAYSLLGAVFPHSLTSLLYWSNAYQLSSLPVVAIAATLGTRILMRLIFRIYLMEKSRDEARSKELEEIKKLATTQANELAELKEIHHELHGRYDSLVHGVELAVRRAKP